MHKMKKKKRNKQYKRKRKQIDKQTATKKGKRATTYNGPCLHHRWRCYQPIALNNQLVWSTSLAPLSP